MGDDSFFHPYSFSKQSLHTMKYLNLDILKKHLNIDDFFHDDDDYITSLGDVAEQMVATHLDDKLSIIANDNDGYLPMPIQHAMLLLVGNLYANREGIAFGAVNDIPHSYDYLLAQYKNYKTSQL